MSFWETHRQTLGVIGGFAGLLFLLWLFFLRGYAYETRTRIEAFEKEKETRERLCPEEGTQVRFLRLMYETSNRKLEQRRADLIERLNFDFSEAEIPKNEIRNRQIYVRKQLKTLRDYASVEVETNRRIEMSDAAAGLGFSIPPDHSELRETDEMWLRQMVAVRRVIDRLLSVHEEPDGTKNILRIHSIRPETPVTEDPPCGFIEEYPVFIELHMRLEGVMRLVQSCSRPGDWMVVRSFEIVSEPVDRETLHVDNKALAKKEDREKYERWYAHYYRVRLTLATPVLADPDKAEKAKPESDKRGTVIKVIPH